MFAGVFRLRLLADLRNLFQSIRTNIEVLMAFSLKKRDFLLVVIAIVILAFLWQAPPESTSRVPYDNDHRQFYDIVKNDGKKAAEKFCEECHNKDAVPFPEGHPAKYRCLFCHKMQSP
jgi:hypothetical protein